ncbi:MAG: hypothetical protein D8M57_00395 [Candidatus Scalindua sp. AMX11]|nr:MAG: hypothetical protein DWQ00_18590 [Candidatus Scalindua sp.]NOG84167.1 hypothetical protein [Planctomycetota bacterium]RZV98927.1 MAG: hypothetical protein EX341_00515 [Candidatus Scalindua sp. SCAELEC01]TDE66881.1 MAG: hypothetical protein D8M57_00395 [Candidatus Scalindua sp. AMX11]GJQ57683.1 MAG: hypothetical protein SCALA701_04840 [Candidatus Scalindua sp.]
MVYRKQMVVVAALSLMVICLVESNAVFAENGTGTTGGGAVHKESVEAACDFIGICTTTPEVNLHIFSHDEVSSSIRLEGNSKLDGSYREYTTITRDNSSLRFFDDDKGEVVTMKENGNVGIGKPNPEYKLDVDGTTRTKIIRITGGSDLSEQFDIGRPHNLKEYIKNGEFKITPGMVACIDTKNPGKLLVSHKAYDRTVAGIISGAGGVRPGMLMGQTGTTADGEFPVALTGRVYCKADAMVAPIQPGDLLTTSDTPGHVMKVGDHDRAQGAIIGKAMSSLDKGKGLVLVLVSLQ